MYYPKSQIKTGLHTKGGELKNSISNQVYKGDYWKTSNGDFFSGKNPDSEIVVNLIPINEGVLKDDTSQTYEIPTLKIPSYNILDPSYKNSLKKRIPEPNYPLSSFPTPTEEDYEIGYIVRYFIKKTNEYKFIEITEFDFQLYKSKDSQVPYQLYYPFLIQWVITGEKDEVYEINYTTTKRTESDLKVYGFSQYFRGNFNQLYKE